MSKKNLIYLIALVLLGSLAMYLVKRNNTGTMGDLKAFAIEDTASISKIIIANKAGATTVLEKGNDGWWMVNKKFHARKDLLALVMDCAKRMEIKSPLPAAAVENIRKSLATSATKVEFWGKDGIIKSMYIGGTTPDEMANYVLLEGQEIPQIVYLPGFNGYFSVRFDPREKIWRDQTLFGYTPQQLDNITVRYPDDAKNSFNVKVVSEEIAQITNFAGDTAATNIDGDFFRKFLVAFRGVFYDALVDDGYLSPGQRDSVIASKPYCTITVIDKKGEKNEVSIHLLPQPIREFQGYLTDKNGNAIVTPDERFYCVLPNKKEIVIIQNSILSRIITQYPRFFKVPGKKEKES